MQLQEVPYLFIIAMEHIRVFYIQVLYIQFWCKNKKEKILMFVFFCIAVSVDGLGVHEQV